MIAVNGSPIKIEFFPDNTQRLNVPLSSTKDVIISWKYETDIECLTLYYIVNHFCENYKKVKITLYIDYFPNARMDRVKSSDEIFTLKWFAKFINDLNFDRVVILDPHSNVTPALINNVKIISARTKLINILKYTKFDEIYPGTWNNIYLYYPDKGAYTKYIDQFPEFKYLFGEKVRDWKTGVIQSLEVHNPTNLHPDYRGIIFMIDDICSHGGSLYYSAKALKEKFPKATILSYTSHTENEFPTLQKAFDEGLITKHYTTNSLYKLKNKNIEII